MLNKFFSATAVRGLALGLVLGIGVTSSFAAEEVGIPHYPIKHPKHAHWSFAGPFGHWDIGQLQRGLKIYKEICSGCHAISLVAFRNLEALNYSPEQVKAFASEI